MSTTGQAESQDSAMRIIILPREEDNAAFLNGECPEMAMVSPPFVGRDEVEAFVHAMFMAVDHRDLEIQGVDRDGLAVMLRVDGHDLGASFESGSTLDSYCEGLMIGKACESPYVYGSAGPDYHRLLAMLELKIAKREHGNLAIN